MADSDASSQLNEPARFAPTVTLLFIQLFTVTAIFGCAYWLVLPHLHPRSVGFVCEDPSLKSLYHDNTVDISTVHAFSLAIVVIIFFIECEPHRCFSTRKVSTDDSEMSLNYRVFRFGHSVLALVFGAVANYLLYQTVKYSFGRLRPHFFDICRPDTDLCRPGDYVEDYNCTGTNAKLVKDAHMSFYSGHSSTAFFYATFAACFLHMRLMRRSLHWAPWLFMMSIVFFGGASFVAGSRVMDNKHHFADVVAGAVVGVLLGITLVCSLMASAVPSRCLATFGKSRRNSNSAQPLTLGVDTPSKSVLNLGELHQTCAELLPNLKCFDHFPNALQ